MAVPADGFHLRSRAAPGPHFIRHMLEHQKRDSVPRCRDRWGFIRTPLGSQWHLWTVRNQLLSVRRIN